MRRTEMSRAESWGELRRETETESETETIKSAL